MMPIGYGSSFAGMPQEKIMNLVEQKFGKMIPYNGKPLGNGPCTYYTVDGFEGKIGFISAISHKFCNQCNRIRLTSQGYLKTCLQYTAGRDLRAVLRNGGTDEELKDRIRAALTEKPDGHHFREKAKEDDTESLCMSASDSGYRGEREDLSGPAIREILEREGYEVISMDILPDDQVMLAGKLQEIADSEKAELILTTGGTGFSERDVTPEATEEVIERKVPGIPEAIRAYSMTITKRAMLSRATAGIRGKTLIINLPGSPKAVRESLEYIIDALGHGIEILTGEAGNCARK